MHKKPYRRYEGNTNDLLIAFIGYVNDLNKLQQFKVTVKNPTIDFKALYNSLDNSTCSSPEVVLVFLLYECSTIHNSSLVFTFSLQTSLFIHPHRQKSDLYAPTSNSCIITPIENWTHVYMNLFTRNNPYYHILKYLLFLLKHTV